MNIYGVCDAKNLATGIEHKIRGNSVEARTGRRCCESKMEVFEE